jgi:predicted ferric reductase
MLMMKARWLGIGYVLALLLPPLVVLADSPLHSFAVLACAFTGIAALMMLSVQFLTSGRFEALAAPLGLDAMMGFHRLAGRIVIAAILVHLMLSVWLAAGSDLREVPSALVRVISSERMATGLISLVLVLALVVLAVRRDQIGLRYEWWRLSHGIGALFLLLLATHHAWANRIVLDTAAAAVVGAGIILALASFGVIYGVRAWYALNSPWTVEKVTPLGRSSHEVTLSARTSPRFDFHAGQFVWVTFGRRHPVTDHPFSIASSPEELPKLRFIIKENGDFTDKISTLAKGTPAYVDGPHGNFFADSSAEAIVLIAGGVGIAPIISIARSLADQSYKGSVALMIATRGELEQLFAAEIERLSGELDIRSMLVVERPSSSWRGEHGRIDAAKLKILTTGIPLSRVEILICGPLPMMAATSLLLMKMGVPETNIKYERFDYHAGDDPKSRTMRRSFLLLFATAAASLVLAAAAAAYFS